MQPNSRCDLLIKSTFSFSSPQAWRWVASGVKRTRARRWSTGPTTQMPRRSMPTWGTTGRTPPWCVIHQLWRCTTTATTVTPPPSRPLVGHLQSWRPLAGPPHPSPQWLWAVPSPVSSQVSLWRGFKVSEGDTWDQEQGNLHIWGKKKALKVSQHEWNVL